MTAQHYITTPTKEIMDVKTTCLQSSLLWEKVEAKHQSGQKSASSGSNEGIFGIF